MTDLYFNNPYKLTDPHSVTAPSKYRNPTNKIYNFETGDGRMGGVTLYWWDLTESDEIQGREMTIHFHVDWDEHVTGGGDATRIYSTVLKVLLKEANITKPERINIHSMKTEKNRLSLYKHIIRKYIKDYMPEYIFYGVKDSLCRKKPTDLIMLHRRKDLNEII